MGTPLRPREPIRIEGDDQLVGERGVATTEVEGREVFVIEGWELLAMRSPAIEIVETTRPLIVRRCNIIGNRAQPGIVLREVEEVVIENCMIAQVSEGVAVMDAERVGIHHCRILDVQGNGVHIARSRAASVSELRVENCQQRGIYLRNVRQIALRNCTLRRNQEGVVLWDAGETSVTRCHIEECEFDGLFVTSSSTILIAENRVIRSEGFGIRTWVSDRLRIVGNAIRGHRMAGLYLKHCRLASVRSNRIEECGVALWLDTVWRSEIYNNYFACHTNCRIDGRCGFIVWATPRIPGRNIVGGSYLGGNYWSDYTGQDRDNDGIGEDPYVIDHINVDELPLVAPTLKEEAGKEP